MFSVQNPMRGQWVITCSAGDASAVVVLTYYGAKWAVVTTVASGNHRPYTETAITDQESLVSAVCRQVVGGLWEFAMERSRPGDERIIDWRIPGAIERWINKEIAYGLLSVPTSES